MGLDSNDTVNLPKTRINFSFPIWHIFLLMTVIAALAVWQEHCVRTLLKFSGADVSSKDVTHVIAWSGVEGGVLTAALILAIQFFRGQLAAFHPGHRLLVINGLAVLVTLLTHSWFCFQFKTSTRVPEQWVFHVNDGIYLTFHFLAALTWYVIYRRHQKACHWSNVYLSHVLLNVCLSVSIFELAVYETVLFQLLCCTIKFLTLVIMFAAVKKDLRNHTTRDQCHGYGIGMTCIAYTVLSLVTLVNHHWR